MCVLVFNTPACLLQPTVRSAMSKLFNDNQSSKVFAMIELFDSFASIVGTVFGVGIYEISVDSNPGSIFLAVAALNTFVATILLLFLCKQDSLQ